MVGGVKTVWRFAARLYQSYKDAAAPPRKVNPSRSALANVPVAGTGNATLRRDTKPARRILRKIAQTRRIHEDAYLRTCHLGRPILLTIVPSVFTLSLHGCLNTMHLLYPSLSIVVAIALMKERRGPSSYVVASAAVVCTPSGVPVTFHSGAFRFLQEAARCRGSDGSAS